MKGGYFGKLLEVNMTNHTTTIRPIDEDFAYQYIGGSGFGAKILWDETGPDTDPLSPDNVLMFLGGPFTGTLVPFSGRHHVISKSPLTGVWGESDVGGSWGDRMKRAGFDGVIVRGASDTPVWLELRDGEVTWHDAAEIWGLDTYETDAALRPHISKNAIVQCIGQAGERLCRIAGVFTDGRDGRAAGRCGLGAVMGSKKLKAIVADGGMKQPIADPEGLKNAYQLLIPEMIERWNAPGYHDYGTPQVVLPCESLGDIPIKNWQGGTWLEGAERLSGKAMAESILTGVYYCAHCVVGCGRQVKVESGPFAPVLGAGPEYENLGMLGTNLMIDQMEAVAKMTELCNRYGLDSISTGSVVGWAMEAFERGILTEKDLGGLTLRWGDAEAAIEMIHLIGQRQTDIGYLLGEGVKRTVQEVGQNSEEFATEVKGLEIPAHDPRARFGLSVGYATGNRGGCHLQAYSHDYEGGPAWPEFGYPEPVDRFGVEGKGVFTARFQNLMSMMDSLKLCKFSVWCGVNPDHHVEWLNLATGWDFTVDSYLEIGERLYNLKRMYNVREGISRKDDTIPLRIATLAREDGGAAGKVPPLGIMLHEYYEYRGWDEFGIPKPDTLARLGLAEVVRQGMPSRV